MTRLQELQHRERVLEHRRNSYFNQLDSLEKQKKNILKLIRLIEEDRDSFKDELLTLEIENDERKYIRADSKK